MPKILVGFKIIDVFKLLTVKYFHLSIVKQLKTLPIHFSLVYFSSIVVKYEQYLTTMLLCM